MLLSKHDGILFRVSPLANSQLPTGFGTAGAARMLARAGLSTSKLVVIIIIKEIK
jgi:hypothetical protein